MRLFNEFFESKDKVIHNPKLQSQLKGLRERAERYLNEDIEPLTLSDFLRFYKTGIRKGYEQRYFSRRGRLVDFALMLIFYNDMKYKDPLEDIIWAICEESTWVLPAHIDEDAYERYRSAIDLFGAETGFALCEIKYILSDVLSDRIKNRIHKEVDERIIKAYLNNTYHWEVLEHNWSSVCASSVGAAFLYEAAPDEVLAVLNRIKGSLDCFLNSCSSEGICLEGYAYWKYGFEFFIAYAELLRQYSDNEIDLFDDERVRKIAEFQDVAILREGRAISFADVISAELPNLGTTYFLYGKYGKLQTLNRKYEPYGYEGCNRWQVMLRDFIWTQSNEENPDICTAGVQFYPDAGWYIKKTQKYILCTKGGSNGDSHNHNDVGSFFIDCNDEEVLCDLGSGEYTHEYFNEGRYEHLVTSSRGHNLPIINGCYQKPGADKKAVIIEADDNIFKADITKAYDIDGIEKIIRSIISDDNSITVSTSVTGRLTSLTERLVSRIEPEITDDGLNIGGLIIRFTDADCEISTETFSNHKFKQETIYLTDITYPGTRSEYRIEILQRSLYVN